MTFKTITHALISVHDKTGIVEFALALRKFGIAILSTGGTAKLLKQHQVDVTELSDFTHFPEIMDGRVKTLHPKIYGGILARAEKDQEMLNHYNFPIIGLVVVNLYPFEQVILQEDCSVQNAIENIDIGGPTLLRAAAKNYQYTTAIVHQEDYSLVLSEIANNLCTTLPTRFELAKKVFAHIAKYDAAISNYFSSLTTDNKRIRFPQHLSLQFQKKFDLRYGENPHQQAAFYTTNTVESSASISHAVQHWGKPMSFNNIADANTGLECVRQFTEPACVIIKHANPCAVAVADSQEDAYKKAYAADPTSAFGGVLAFNTLLDVKTVKQIIEQQFVEVIIASEITNEALKFAQQKQNLRILTVGDLSLQPQKELEIKSVHDGVLIQDQDNLPSLTQLEVVSIRQPSEREMSDLLFAWQVVRFTKSNAIVYARDKTTIGIGAGQMSRVFSAKIAAYKAAEAKVSLANAVMASDAFFPFADSIEEAAAIGITAIIQPGGSLRDQEVIEAANKHNMVMVFTHIRHFRH